MRALIPTGRPDELTTISEIETPRPGADEALIRVTEFSLNRADFLYLSSPGTTFRPGIDAAGIVERAAADGSGPAASSRVVLHLPAGGAGAEYVVASADRLAVIPGSVSSATAAALPMGGLVARRLLSAAGPLAGRRILATGAGGGVGQILIQLAVAAGAEIVVIADRRQPWQHMVRLGATVVHDVDEVPDGSVDVVVESVGGELGSATTHKLRTGGLFLWFGEASGQPLTLDFFELLRAGQSLTLRHFVYRDDNDASDAGELAALLDLVADDTLRVEIGRSGHWSQTAEFLAELAAGRLRGKAVLAVA